MAETPSIAIVGAGFGGICLGILLKRAGIDTFAIYDKGSDVGGVWRDNTYPGAACDVPSRMYSYSFAQDHPWSTDFAPQREILDYLRSCVRRYGLEPHLRFHSEVNAAGFDEARGLWSLAMADGSAVEASIFVSAVGLFSRPVVPSIPGQDLFQGPQFHSARWDHGFDPRGKTVAVVGTGASAIQFVPEIAKVAEKVVLFQRSAPYVMPKARAGLHPWLSDRIRRHPWFRRYDRWRIYLDAERGTRRRRSEAMTQAAAAAFRERLAREVASPALRAKLTPDYVLGCKRVLLSDDWYATLQRPNVEVVDTRIEGLTEDGIGTADGAHRAVDAVIYGTGFAPADYLTPMAVTGLGGRSLDEVWRAGAEAYLGIALSGFPNFFMLYGPNTNVAGSIVYMLESQARYIVRAVRGLMRRKARSMHPREDAQRRYNAGLQERIGRTVLVREGCRSYFMAASGKVTTQWPGFMAEYRYRTRRIRPGDYVFLEGGAGPDPSGPPAR